MRNTLRFLFLLPVCVLCAGLWAPAAAKSSMQCWTTMRGLHGVLFITEDGGDPHIVSSTVEAAAFIDYLTELASE